MTILEEDIVNDDIKDRFKDNFDNLRKDINNVELMLSSINKHIMVLEAQLNSIEAALKAANTNGADKGKLYQILNRAQELLSMYYDNYNRYLETRYKYRKEQDELNYKVIRLTELELKNIKNNTPSSIELLEMLKGLSFDNNSIKTKLENELDAINNDPLYEL